MPRNRPSLSSPTYGSLTGNINWSRGMGEQLANPGIVSFVPAPAPAPSPAPKASIPSPSPGTVGGGGGGYRIGRTELE